MKIKTAWLKNKKYLIKCEEIREMFPQKFSPVKINAGRLDEKMKANPQSMRY